MEEVKAQSPQNGDEVSIKELLVKVFAWWRYLWSKWIIILVVGVIGGALGLVFALFSTPKYIGEITFVLEDNNSNSLLGAYAGLANQFGLNMGSSSSGVFAGDNILLFLKSRLMVEKTLLQPVDVHGKEQTLANLYIDFRKLREAWKKDSVLSRLDYPLGQPRNKFSLVQDSVLNAIRQSIVDKNLDISKPDKDLNFISVKCKSANELFSKVFAETLVKEAVDFYITTKTMQSKANVDKLEATADSIEMLLNKKSYSIAAAQDMNLNPAKQRATIGMELQARDKMVLQTMYVEVVKNLELSKIAMAQETPLIRVVDTPILPLEKDKLGKLRGILLGGLLLGGIAVAFLIAKRIYEDIMKS